jgi:cryptochrome
LQCLFDAQLSLLTLVRSSSSSARRGRKKTDPNGDYIRKWLPQFKQMPARYIYEPWTAPLDVQRRCGVVVGVSYPHPVVDHATASKSNMGRMKAAYDAHNRRGGGGDDGGGEGEGEGEGG